MTRAELYGFLSRHKLGVLAYLSEQGTPWSVWVGIAVTPELEIVFDTVSSSRKYGDLFANRAACFVIGWDGEMTAQYEGQAFQPAAAELTRYQQIYFEAWPDGPERLSWPGIAWLRRASPMDPL